MYERVCNRFVFEVRWETVNNRGDTNIPILIAQKCDRDAGLQKLLDIIGHGRTAEGIFRIKDKLSSSAVVKMKINKE